MIMIKVIVKWYEQKTKSVEKENEKKNEFSVGHKHERYENGIQIV